LTNLQKINKAPNLFGPHFATLRKMGTLSISTQRSIYLKLTLLLYRCSNDSLSFPRNAVIPAKAGIHCFCHSERSEESPFGIQNSLFFIRYSPSVICPSSSAFRLGGSLKRSLGMAPPEQSCDFTPAPS
jgi:hypothetical protein